MEQVKLFFEYDVTDEGDSNLQKNINKWFKKHPNIKVLDRKQSVNEDFDVLVSIFYTEDIPVQL